VQVQRVPFACALHLTFPQLWRVPIRYGHVAHELAERKHTWTISPTACTASCSAWPKKVLIANVVGGVADQCFKLPQNHVTSMHATPGVAATLLQIYSTSGYSVWRSVWPDVRFISGENSTCLNSATSITDFWKRWHIS